MHKIKVIAGPTASGKSARALDIAERANGVIINADALQVYAELPILTAQPGAADKERARHVLYGFLEAGQPCSAGSWAQLAEREIRAAWAQGQLPVVTGGSGLYLKALMQGFSAMPLVDAGIRDWAAGIWQEGKEAARALLVQHDPEVAQRLKPNDKQRHIRALEVWKASGRPLSWWQAQPAIAPFPEDCYDVEIIDLPRTELYQRCDMRFVQMLEQGALEEVKSCLAKASAIHDSRSTTTQALGYKELSAYLQGNMTLEEATQKAQQATRNYAKRQVTWFKNQT